jgi:hypothetical protein
LAGINSELDTKNPLTTNEVETTRKRRKMSRITKRTKHYPSKKLLPLPRKKLFEDELKAIK